MKDQHILTLAAANLIGSAAAAGPDASKMPLPPMGFNNWSRYGTNISQAIFTDAAAVMNANGLRALGYNRLNLDDAWSTHARAANGSMVWDEAKFPEGLPWLAQHIRDAGFIPGIYSDAGDLSCGEYPGAFGYEALDLKIFSDWGYDYLKLDGCNVPANIDDGGEQDYHAIYGKWMKLLQDFPKQVIFSNSAPAYFCSSDNLTDWYNAMGWSSEFGQLARHSGDIINYDRTDLSGWYSLMYNYGFHVLLSRYQRPGYFNDPDFLVPDHRNFTLTERRTHMALWSTFSAPLIISAEMPTLGADELALLSNKDLIAIDQDPLVQQATLASSSTTLDVLTKTLANGDRVVTMLNKNTTTAANITVSWARAGIQTKGVDGKTELRVKNLWTGETATVKLSAGGISAANVPSHGTAVFRISGIASNNLTVTPTGSIVYSQGFRKLRCLTDNKSGTVSIAACDGSDAQTWVTRKDGHINSLLRPDECIVDAKGKLLSRHSGCHTDAWKYYRGGNLVNANNGHCLTANKDGPATAEPCGRELTEQVFSLPVGIDIRDDQTW